MAVTLAFTLIGLLVILGSSVIGYLYWLKRDTQKIADLAALAGAARMDQCTTGNDNSAADANAKDANHLESSATIVTQCGRWNPSKTGGDHFTAGGGTAMNAVKAEVSRTPAPWISLGLDLPTITASAIATGSPPVAAFSVTPALASLNHQALLGQLLQAVGLDPSQLDLVGYNGLANVRITPSGLLSALGIDVPVGADVGTINQLLDTKVGLSQLLDAEVGLAGQNGLLGLNAQLLSALQARLGVSDLQVQLGSSATSPGIFALLQGPDANADTALTAQVDALQLLATSIGVATGQHAVSLGANASTLNLGLLSLTAAASVIEPPSIGIGGVGTTANSAQIRIFLHLQSGTDTLASSIPLLGDLVSALIRLQVDIPVAIDVVQAMGTLTDLCDPDDPETLKDGIPRATIRVDASLLQTCIGNFSQADAFSTVSSCVAIPGASSNKQLLSVGTGTLLGNAQLLGLNTHMLISALPASGSVTLAAGQSGTVGNQLLIGDTVSNLVTALTGALLVNTAGGGSTASCNGQGLNTCYQLAQDLWNTTSGSTLARLWAAQNTISTTSSGLTGFLGGTLNGVLGLLGGVLTLNPIGIADGLGTVLTQVGGLLADLTVGPVCALGSQNACITLLATGMAGNTSSGSANVVPLLLGFLLQALQPALNAIGSVLLTPLLQDVLGLNLGVTTVHLDSLQCHAVHLVY